MELQQVQFSCKHVSYTQGLGSGQMGRRHKKSGAKKKILNFWSCPCLHSLMGTETDQQGLINHRIITLLSKLLASYISSNTSCSVISAQLSVRRCCPIWWSSFQSLSFPSKFSESFLCFLLFCLENKFFRDKRSRDKEHYYAVFALRDDFVLFCLLCL